METLEKVKHNGADTKEVLSQEIIDRVRKFSSSGHKAIEEHLEKLEKEFPIERLLTMGAAAIGVLALVMARRDRRWLLLSAAVALFTTQHAITGKSLPVALFKKFGFRAGHEIEQEKLALRALRGDFDNKSMRSVLKNLR